jgi:hypothetical protein
MNEANPLHQFTEIGQAAATRTPPRKRTGTQILLTILALILLPLGGIVVVCGIILWEGGRGTLLAWPIFLGGMSLCYLGYWTFRKGGYR